MNEKETFDLSSVNQAKKSKFSLPKFKNPFAKSSTGQQRDEAGKFASGSGGLKTLKKFNWGRAVPLVIVAATVGGYFVYQSFAGTQLYAYQYSAYQCDVAKNTPSGQPVNFAPGDTCVRKSAEALTYRLYKGVFNRKPDEGGYKFWTQQLAGERNRPTRVAERMLATNEAMFGSGTNTQFVEKAYTQILGRTADTAGKNYWVGQLDTKKKTKADVVENFARTAKITTDQAMTKMGRLNNQDFVKAAYRQVMGREGDSKGVQYWTGRLNDKSASRHLILASFAVDNGSIEKLSAEQTEYIKSTPKVAVEQTARKAQEKRTADAKPFNESSRRVINNMRERSTDNNARKVDAGKIAGKAGSQISQGDLNVISENYVKIIKQRLDGFKGADWQGKVNGNYNKVKVLYDQAVDVTNYSPDITNVGITNEERTARSYKNEAQRHVDNANWLLGETNRALKIATDKRNAHQAYLAAKADCESKGGTYSGGRCNMPVVDSVDDEDGEPQLTETQRCQQAGGIMRGGECTSPGGVTNCNKVDYVVAGNSCVKKYASPADPRCASGYPNLKSTSATFGSGSSTYTITGYYCGSNNGSYSHQNFRSLGCPSGYPGKYTKPGLHTTVCHR